MIEDLSDHSHPAIFNTQVAIVGAGAAGITLARRLAAANIQARLLESGGRDNEQLVQDLAKGEKRWHSLLSVGGKPVDRLLMA